MTPLVLTLLAGGSFVAGAVSAVLGAAGGSLLLSMLLLALDPRAVVPVHGAVQLITNVSRIVAFWSSIQWRLVAQFSLAVAPGSLAGALLVGQLEPRTLQIVLGVGLLVSVLGGGKVRERNAAPRWFYLVGGVVGFLSMLVGSTGHLLSQGLLWAGVTKEAHVATKAACQATSNVIKLVLFGAALEFDFAAYAPMILILGAAGAAGTYLGKSLLGRLSEGSFVMLTRLVLAGLAVKTLVG